MEIIELNIDNVSDYEDILDQDIRENIGREFYRGIVAEDDGSSLSGAMIWEYKNLEEDADTDAEICYINSEGGESIKELLSEFDEQVSGENVCFSYFETGELSDDVKKGFSDAGFDITTAESRDLIIRASDLSALAAKKKKIPEKVVGLKNLMELQFMQGVTNCLFHGKKGIIVRRHNESVTALAGKLFEGKSGGQVIRGERR